MATDNPRTIKPRNSGHRLLVAILWILVILLAAALGYTLWLNRSLKSPETQTKIAEQASQEIIVAVSKIIVVPDDKPTVATITDVDKLRKSNAEFYKDAKNGDILLIYSTQAIIFRKEENRIIAVAPVVVNPEATSNTTKNTSNDDDSRSTDEENTTNEATENLDSNDEPNNELFE